MFERFDAFMIDGVFRRLVDRLSPALYPLEVATVALIASLAALLVAVAVSPICWLLVVFAGGLYAAITSRLFLLRREQIEPTPDHDFRKSDFDLRAFTAALILVLIVVGCSEDEVGWVDPSLLALVLFAASNWFAACSEVGRGKGRRVFDGSDYNSSTVVDFPARPLSA